MSSIIERSALVSRVLASSRCLAALLFVTRKSPVAAALSKAAGGLVRGIERRSQRVVVPRYVYPLILAGELLRPALDAASRRQMADLLAGAERQPERDPERSPVV